MTTTYPHRKRLTASAREEGLAACPWDAMDRCDLCNELGPCHRESRYTGGRGYSLVSVCHHVQGCERRRGW